MRRLVPLTIVLLLGIALPVSAKMPPFETEVEARGDTLEVTVRIIGDESLIEGFDTPELNGLIAVFPVDQVDEEGRPLYVLEGGTDVGLSRVEPGIYEGSVALEPGRWAVVPFPGVSGVVRGSAEGWYPDTVLIELTDDKTALWALVAVGAAMTVAWRFRDVVPVGPHEIRRR